MDITPTENFDRETVSQQMKTKGRKLPDEGDIPVQVANELQAQVNSPAVLVNEMPSWVEKRSEIDNTLINRVRFTRKPYVYEEEMGFEADYNNANAAGRLSKMAESAANLLDRVQSDLPFKKDGILRIRVELV